MDLRSTQLKDTYGNLLTIGTSAGSPTTGTLQNGQGTNITALDVGGTITSDGLTSDGNISLSGNGTGTRWLFLGSETASYAGTFRLQAGGGSAGFGGGITMYGHSHASNPGDVAVGISSGSGGSFRVNAHGTDTGLDLLEVKSNRDIAFFDGSANEAFYWDASTARLGLGTQTPGHPLTVTANPGSADTPVAWIHNSGNATSYDGTVISTVNDGSDVEVLHVRTNNTTYANGTSLMLVRGDGNVGIGVSPSRKLSVNGVAGFGNGTIETIISFSDRGIFGTQSNHDLEIRTNGSERLRIDSSGQVGIGETNPSNKLEVNSGSTQTVSIFKASSTSTTTNNGGALIGIRNTNDTNGNMEGLFFQNSNGVGTSGIIGYNVNHSTNEGLMTFGVRNSSGTYGEKMRIDSSGDLTMKGGRIIVRESDDGNDAVKITRDADEGYVQLFSAGTQTIELRGNGDSYFNGGNVLVGKTASSGVATGNIEVSNSSSASVQIEGGTHEWSMLVSATTDALRFYQDSTERLRIDSSGNVLVGKTDANNTSQGNYFQASDGFNSMVSTSNTALLLNRLTTDGTLLLFRKDSTTVGSIGASGGRLYIGSDDTSIFFDSGASPSLRPHGPADPDGVIDIGEDGYRFKDLYLSGSVYLGGTTSANALDDYEEGTWTPVLRGSGTAGTYEFATSGAYYTKVGRMVTVTANLVLSASVTGGGTGYAKITGLPYAKGANMAPQGTVLFRNVDFADDADYVNVEFVTSSASSELYFPAIRDNTGTSDTPISAFGNSNTINLSITYFT